MSIGLVLLAVWLVLTGLITLFGLSFDGIGVIMGILALAAGIFLLIGDNWRGGRGRGRWKLDIGAGMLLLAIWLILTGLFALTGLTFAYRDVIMGLLALAAGVLLIIRR